LVFDKKGFLFISMGERGQEKIYPQDITTAPGKIHRIKDDGSIPADNPFVGKDKAIASIYTYGNRNPQGMAMDPVTGLIWENEHGPRGGDELNIIKAGANYGWPVISYGINYDGKPITPISKKEGMQQPVTYWIPSIAPSGLAFVTGDKYPAWKGSLMVGSLRFAYLNRCIMKDNKVVGEEKLLLNIGRLRNIEMGRDGYLYVSVENPGNVFRLMPVK
jgi:glucose/arabinose dehydrogenase